jgi:glycosyltransferase involved in cell wall biosynthesis
MGHECDFLAPETAGKPYFPTRANIIYSRRFGVITENNGKIKKTKLDNVMSIYYGIKKIGHRYDVILANHSLTAWPVYFAKCGMARKFYYIQAYEPPYYSPLTHPLEHLLARFSYVLPLKQIANSWIYKGAGLHPIDVVPPGIDLSIFTRKDSDIGFTRKKEIVLGTIGRAEPYKGTATAIAAYRMLRATDPRLRLKVALGNVEISDDIEIVDIKNDIELSEYYRSLDALIVSCYSQEGGPHYPVIEAMASGVPVVHTGYYPGEENISWVAKQSSATAVAEALGRLLSSSESEIVEKTDRARTIIEEDLEWNMVGRRFLSAFSAST